MMNTLDVSKHQASYSPRTAVAAGICATILRHAYGTSTDSKAVGWADGVKAAGQKLGGYGFGTWHYKGLNGGSVEAARKLMTAQVTKWISLAKDTGADWWFAIDQELESGQVMGLGMADNTMLINEAASMLRTAGLNPCLYCSVAWDMQYVRTATLEVPYWMARYYDGKADFADAGADLSRLPAGRYTDWMRQLYDSGRLIGWQYGSTGLGNKYGCGSANVDRNAFYASPANGQSDFGAVKPQSESKFISVGPVSGGDAKTICAAFTDLQISCTTTDTDGGLHCIVSDFACSTGDQAKIINLAAQLCVPVQLLEVNDNDQTAPPADNQEPDQSAYTVVFLGFAVKGGFESREDAIDYIESVLGKDAMDKLGISVTLA